MGRPHPRDLARLLGVGWRARLRGHRARPRPALHPRQRLGQDHVSPADRSRPRNGSGLSARASRNSPTTPRSMSGRCTGRSGPGRWRCRAIRNSTRFALTLYDAPMRKPDGFSSDAVAVQAADRRIRAGRCQEQLPLSEQRARACSRRSRAASTTAWSPTCWATSPSLPTPTSSWARTAWCSRRSPNGTFLNGITRQRVIGLLRGAGVEVVETVLKYADFDGPMRSA